jgi:hypothetical protein
VVLLNRDTALAEMTPQHFAGTHNMRLLADDNVAVGQAIAIRVETFILQPETISDDRIIEALTNFFDPRARSSKSESERILLRSEC